MEQRIEQKAQSDLSYKIIPVKSTFLQRARESGVDDQGQTVERLIASGGEPCRDSLHRAKAGEELILASYCPFEVASPYKEYGPVFIRAHAHEHKHTHTHTQVHPPHLSDLVKQHYLGQQFVLRAYSAQERIVDACLTAPLQCEVDLQALLAKQEVKFVLVRFPTYGCYACRIERVPS
ncbi:DUF1203 domain-containing protein [Undibacterium flavidum]|uniref:DUF1203 domain-containing protein n=1 Tax=Undibacterium flavidum TaxID=2762297 RepID=A0ABR6YF05_9BURK|nr:DUF1203 domain-containing protein [Undibacterium flavidum]MBC3875166.1 DUF1203 domain-containing protein [Undibacterium flavidum]